MQDNPKTSIFYLIKKVVQIKKKPKTSILLKEKYK